MRRIDAGVDAGSSSVARKQWVLVLLLALGHCLSFADRTLLALLAPLVKKDLQLSDFEVGLLLGTMFVGTYAIATIALRKGADRHDRINLILLCLIASGIATATCGLATGFLGLAASRAGLGLAQALFAPSATSLIAMNVPRPRLGQAISVFTSGSTAGRSVALILGGIVLSILTAEIVASRGPTTLPWRLTFMAFAVPNFLLAAVLLWTRRPLPNQPGRHELPLDLRRWARHLRCFYVAHTVTSAAIVLTIQTLTAWMTTILVRRYGMSVSGAGTTFGLIVLAFAPLGHWTGGAVLDRAFKAWGLRAPGLIMGAALLVSVLATACLAATHSPTLALADLTLLTFVLGIASPCGLAGMQYATPEHLRGRATALFLVAATSIGFGLGPPALGLLTDRLFGSQGIAEALVFVVLVTAMAGGAGVVGQWLRLKPY